MATILITIIIMACWSIIVQVSTEFKLCGNELGLMLRCISVMSKAASIIMDFDV